MLKSLHVPSIFTSKSPPKLSKLRGSHRNPRNSSHIIKIKLFPIQTKQPSVASNHNLFFHSVSQTFWSFLKKRKRIVRNQLKSSLHTQPHKVNSLFSPKILWVERERVKKKNGCFNSLYNSTPQLLMLNIFTNKIPLGI